MRILIVDDNEANRILAQSILEREGHITVTASSGKKALIECSGVKFDLVLLDILMPEMNGIQTIKKLRQSNGRNAITPVFALTAYSSPTENRLFKQAGFKLILPKPLRQNDVERAWNTYQNQQTNLTKLDRDFETKSAIVQSLIDQRHWDQIKMNAHPNELVSTTSKFWKSADIHMVAINENKIQASLADTESLSKLRRGAHALKGSAATLALKRLETISGNLQNALPERILSLVEDIEKCTEESKLAHLAELKALVVKRGSLANHFADEDEPTKLVQIQT